MKKTVKIASDETKIRKIVRDEIRGELENLKSGWGEELIGRFTKIVFDFKNEVMNGLDQVMGELKTIREEQTLVGQKLADHSDQLENHEVRIGKIEPSSLSRSVD